MPAALKNGDVDAIVIWEPHGYNAQKLLQADAVSLDTSGVYKETFNFMVMKEFATAHPGVLEKFLRATNAATDFINQHKDDAQALVAKSLELDPKITSDLWDDFVFEMSLEQSLIRTLEEEAVWAVTSSLVGEPDKPASAVPNYLDYIHLDSLKTVKSEAVTIVN